MFTLLDVSVFFVHFIFLSVCSVFILFLLSSFILLLMYAFSIRFDCKFRCVPIRLTNSDLTLACNTIHFLFPIFCFVIYLFVFIFGSSFYIFFLLLSNPQYSSGVIVTVSSLKPAILYIVVAAAIVFFVVVSFKIVGFTIDLHVERRFV